MNHRIRVRWIKQRRTLGILCEHRIPIKLKENFIRPVMLYGTEY